MRNKGVRVLLVILLLFSLTGSAFWCAFVGFSVKLSRPERVVYDGHEVEFTRDSDKKKLSISGSHTVVYQGYLGESPVSLTVNYTKEEYAALAPNAKLTGFAYFIVGYPAEYYLAFDHAADKSEIDKTLRSQEITLALRLSVPGDILIIAAVALLVLLIKGRKAKAETTASAVTAK